VLNHHNLSTTKVQIIINNPEISRTHDFPSGHSERFEGKKTNRPPPAPNLLAIFESETTEGGKVTPIFREI
jgi:hypothetical protein